MFQADKVFINGNIITIDDNNPHAEAIAVIGDRIVAVGSNDDIKNLIGPTTKVHDFGGKTVIPGINDCHLHLATYGLNLLNVNMTPGTCPSFEVMKQKIAERAAKVGPGVWIYGWGYNETLMKERSHPTVAELTEAAPNNPVLVERACCHTAVANKMALQIGGIDRNTPDPAGGIIRHFEDGEPNGILSELSAMGLVKKHIPTAKKAELLSGLDLASKYCLSVGITSVMDAGNLVAHEEELPAWFQAATDGTLKVRCYSSLTEDVAEKALEIGLRTGYGNEMHRIGPVKFFMDGNISGRSAGMYEPFLVSPYGTGVLYCEPDIFAAKVKKYHDAGFQIATHSIGDRTSEVVLNAYEAALKANPRPNHRHRIEHNTLGEVHVQRIKNMGVLITHQPAFIYFLGADFEPFMGKSRSDRIMAAGSAERLGMPWGCSTDCPVTVPDPKYPMYSAITRNVITGGDCGKDQCVSPYQALRAYTANGAYLSFEENIKGRIKSGMLADFVAVSIDPLNMETPEDMLKLAALQTFLGGNLMYEA